jgi:hypothetical protein
VNNGNPPGHAHNKEEIDETLRLHILPGILNSEVGDYIAAENTLHYIPSGQSFPLTLIVTNLDNQHVDIRGHFRFTWSAANFINPSNPPNPSSPLNTNRSYPVKNGIAFIHGLDFPESGIIQLTGKLTLITQGPIKKIVYGASNPIVFHPAGFIITHTFDPDSESGKKKDKNEKNGIDTTYPAGTPFTLTIYAVNSNNQILQNYPWDNLTPPTRQISLVPVVVEPEESSFGELRIQETQKITSFPASSFVNGLCVIEDLSFTDVGVIQITVTDPSYMGIPLTGTSGLIGRFVPAAFTVSVNQPPAVLATDAQYTYSGQPFSATFTIAAVNQYQVPEITRNYQGGDDEMEEISLEITLPQQYKNIGDLSYPDIQLQFEDGKAETEITPITLTFATPHDPVVLALQYAYRANDDLEGQTEADPVEFRYGRLRLGNAIAPNDDYLRIVLDILYYKDDRWIANEDEDFLSITPSDIHITNSDNPGTVSIVGNAQTFFGGKIRGGANPLHMVIDTPDPVAFSLGITEDSPLDFLEIIEGQWRLYPRHDPLPIRSKENQILFLYEIEP